MVITKIHRRFDNIKHESSLKPNATSDLIGAVRNGRCSHPLLTPILAGEQLPSHVRLPTTIKEKDLCIGNYVKKHTTLCGLSLRAPRTKVAHPTRHSSRWNTVLFSSFLFTMFTIFGINFYTPFMVYSFLATKILLSPFVIIPV